MKRRSKAGNRGRGLPVRPPKTTVLIVCEGKKTEPVYFNHWKKRFRAVAEIEIVPGDRCGTNPKNIVEYAKHRKTEGDYDQVWCVFDHDQHQKIDQAMVQARDNNIAIAFSNPCFELWFLLHFKNQTAPIERNKAASALKKYISGYEKSTDVYEPLLPGQSDAVSRAQKLRARHVKAGDQETHNPSTGVDRLVVMLNTLRPGPAL